MMRRAAPLMTVLSCAVLNAAAQQAVPKLPGLPGTTIWQNGTANWSADSAGQFTLACLALYGTPTQTFPTMPLPIRSGPIDLWKLR